MKNRIITRFSVFIAAMALLIFSASNAYAITNSTSVIRRIGSQTGIRILLYQYLMVPWTL